MSELRVCRYCGEAPDGDRFAFVDLKATRCSKWRCLRQWEQEYDRELRDERDRRRAIRERNRRDAARKKRRKVKGRAA